jgi:HSP20 family molecular chaperone IbpA
MALLISTPSRPKPKERQEFAAVEHGEKSMTSKSHHGKSRSVLVVAANILDRMNETDAMIAQRAYEIYQSRGCGHGSDQEDWFTAEREVLRPLAVERHVTDTALRLTAQVPGFAAKDLEVEVGHRRAVICVIHSVSSQLADDSRGDKKIMRVVELPFDVDPALSAATLQSGELQVVFPRSR